MRARGLSLLALGAALAVVGVTCNAVTGLDDLEFTRAPDAPGTGGGGAGGAGGAGGMGPGEVLWARHFGDVAEDYPSWLGFAPGGDLVMTGAFTGNVDFGGGPLQSVELGTDAFVARFDRSGAPLFVTPFDVGGGSDCVMDALITPSDQVIALLATAPAGTNAGCLAANYYDELSVGTYTNDHAHFGLRVIGADGVAAPEIPICDGCAMGALGPLAVAQDGAGNIYIAGGFAGASTVLGQALTSVGAQDVLVAKLDPAGIPLWIRRFGDMNGYAHATDMVVDGQGGVVIAGVFYASLTFGSTTHTAASSDIFLARLDASGAPVWSKSFVNAWRLAPPRLALASDGILMTGDFQQTTSFGGDTLSTVGQDATIPDGYLAKFTLTGDHVFSQRIADAPSPLQLEQGGTGLALTPEGNIVLAGAFGGSVLLDNVSVQPTGLRDAFVALLDPAGGYLGHRHIRSIGSNSRQGDILIALDPLEGRAAVAGAFLGEIDVGHGQPYQSMGVTNYDDGFVVVFEDPAAGP